MLFGSRLRVDYHDTKTDTIACTVESSSRQFACTKGVNSYRTWAVVTHTAKDARELNSLVSTSPRIGPRRPPSMVDMAVVEPGEYDSDEVTVIEEHVVEPNNTIMGDDSTQRNVILNLESLVLFMCRNFVCRVCKQRLEKGDFDHLLWGIAAAVNWTCRKCDTLDQITPNPLVSEGSSTDASLFLRKGSFMRKDSPLTDFELNWRFTLAVQKLGGGEVDATILCSFLGLRSEASYCYAKLEQQLGVTQVELGTEILDENLSAECTQSDLVVIPTGQSRRYLSVQVDCGWSNRGSGRSYNSDSGHSVMFGNKTKKII